MERKCEVCEKVFDGRADAKCCSDVCRQNRRRLSVTEGVTDKELSVTGVTDVVTDKLSVTEVCRGCLERDTYIEELEEKIRDWDVRTMIIRGHITSAEKRADLAEKELAGYRRGGKPQSIYKIQGAV